MKSKKDVIFNEMSIMELTGDERDGVCGGIVDGGVVPVVVVPVVIAVDCLLAIADAKLYEILPPTVATVVHVSTMFCLTASTLFVSLLI